MSIDGPLNAFRAWYQSLPTCKPGDTPSKGTAASALVVLERLRTVQSLDLAEHTTPGGTQIAGVTAAAVSKILARFGETGPVSKEGGRTNRGLRSNIGRMLQALNDADFSGLPPEQRTFALDRMQQFLMDQGIDFRSFSQLKPAYDPAQTTWQFIYDLLLAAGKTHKEGPVAQHLVGAKLQLRFPNLAIMSESYSTADDQTGRPGDFFVGSTAFHVTVAPAPPVYEKCRHNLEQGLRAYLLVPDRSVVGARQNAEMAAPGRISVASIEGFVSQNVEEQSTFHYGQLVNGLYALLTVYNRRVSDIEPDRSMMIEIPRNLAVTGSGDGG
ncbi:MAG TPA: DUF4928 family protein [Armatimonadota bacterium]|nr:DUF4928 family protein [Armatimonadota bacterium]